MTRFREPLLIPFLAFAAGIVLNRLLTFELRETLYASAALFAVAWFAAHRNRWSLARLSMLLGFVACGSAVAVWRAPGPPPQLDAPPSEIVMLSGCIVEPPKFAPDREQFVLELAPRARARVSLFLKSGEPAPPLMYGQRVQVEGRARPPRNYRNEGAFDIESFLSAQEIFWLVSARSVTVSEGTCGNAALRQVFAVRSWLLDRISEAYGADAPKLAALLIGESAALDRAWTEAFRKTGTYHALVVSGTHVTLLAGVFLWLLRLAWIREFPRLVLVVAITWGYAWIAGASIPVLRAAAGFTLFAVCRFFYRRARLLNLLAAVAWGFVIADPRQLFDASFHLSFGALAAIAGLAMPLSERWLDPWRQAARRLRDRRIDPRLDLEAASKRVELRLAAETISLLLRIQLRAAETLIGGAARAVTAIGALILVSAVVQLALALPFAAYFHRYAFTALAANVVVVTLLELAIPIGFAGTLLPWSPLVHLGRWLVNTAAAASQWHSRFEPSWRIPDPPVSMGLALLASLLLLAAALRHRSRWTLAAGLASVGLTGALILHPFAVDAAQGQLELTMVDVGQGDALFLSLPNGNRLMVDAGGLPSYGRSSRPLDIGEAVVSPYLWSRSIRTLDAVVLTHAHADHMGGMASLIENFAPRELWISGLGRSAAFAELKMMAASRGLQIREMRAGSRFEYGGAVFEVLTPPADASNEGEPRNNDSLGVRVQFGQRSFFLTGDAERAIEESLVMDALPGKIDVLKVAHHGGRTSTTPPLIDSARPAFALISSGENNRFGHPHPEVLERLKAAGASILRTDRDGRITIRTDGKRLILDTYRWNHARLTDFARPSDSSR